MSSGRSFLLAVLVAMTPIITGCAGALAQQRTELEGQLEQLRESVQGAIERGGRAPSCAPKALAYAEAELTFAEQTLTADQLERAAAHIDEGRRWIEQAWQRIEADPEACQPPR